MKITRENYKEILDEAMTYIDRVPRSHIQEIQLHIDKLKNELKESRRNADVLLLDNSVLKIGIVGQVKAGKSSFLNSLIFNGENVLPKAATPMTAGLTVLEYAEENHFEVEFYNTAEWNSFESKARELEKALSDFKASDPTITLEQVAQDLGQDYLAAKELVESCNGNAKACVKKESMKRTEKFSSIEDMQLILNNYVGADGTFTPVVKCLTIRWNDSRLKEIQIVDTPGVNDPVVSREERTREFLNECHGVFLLSYAGRFFDKTDVDFLVNRIGANGIGSVVVIASKYDSVLQDAGIKYDDDLGGAAEYCFKSLKKQLINNISNSDFRGSTPAFDYSSGIGYSIYKKPESKWDATEKHVVSQMKRFYPSFFSTIEDIKQTFYDLSQIDEIQTQYLDKVFTSNKETVIQSKLDNYFTGMSQTLIKSVDKSINEISNHLKRLEEGQGSNLKDKKEGSNKLMEELTKGINKCSNEIKLVLNNGVKHLLNNLSLSGLSLSKSTEVISCIRLSTFWGREKKFTVDVYTINKQKTFSDGKSTLINELKKQSEQWSKIVEEAISILKNKLRDVVDHSEQNDKEGINVADQLRDIIDNVVNSFLGCQVFSYKKLQQENEISLTELVQNIGEVSKYIKEGVEEHEAVTKVKDEANNILNSAQSSFDRWKWNVEEEIGKELENVKKGLIHDLENNRDKMISEIKSRFNNYINELEKELENFEAHRKHYKESMENLEKIRTLI